MQSALASAGIKSFDFDLIAKIKITPRAFSERLLSTVGFACSAYIKVAIDAELRALQTRLEDPANELPPKWDSYQGFLLWVSGLAANEEMRHDAGLDTTELRKTVQALYTVRQECYDAVAAQYLTGGYTVPDLHEFFTKPRMRDEDAETKRKAKAIIAMEATDEDSGAIDVELEQQLAQMWDIKSQSQRENQLLWDKRRGEVASLFFKAMKISDCTTSDAVLTAADSRAPLSENTRDAMRVGETVVQGEVDPFLDLPSAYQYRLLTRTRDRYIGSVLTQLAKDTKVPYEECMSVAIEARKFRKELNAALEHPLMVAAGVTLLNRS